MLKTFLLTGYAVNRRGLTTGVRLTVRARNVEDARNEVRRLLNTSKGYVCPRFTSILEARV